MLVACGGGGTEPATRFATASGPIKTACVNSGRSAANRQICGCIQAAADQTLSGADQRRGAPFFRDAALAHSVRLSDTERDDAFWARWSRFGSTARDLCS
ncbi:MAG: hypothetical protein HEP69_13465 [Aestuariivita sp.]|nr:hypothetical protein [Aestuariivita sp.]